MNIINEVVDENGRPPYTQKKYNYKTRHSIITDVYNEVIRLRTEIAKLSKQIRYTQNPQEREELIAKRQELYKLRNRAVAKVWNLSNERTMTQGAKDRAAIKRRENKPKATNINTAIESKTMNKKLIRLTESDIHRIVKESVKRILREESEEDKRKRQMNDDWSEIERRRNYLNTSFPKDSKYTQSSLGDDFANSWARAGKKPGALAMDAQLPYEHPYTTQRGGLYKKADTSKWSEPSMQGRGYEGQNAARNFARNIRFKNDSVAGMTPYPYDGTYGPTGNIYGDVDRNNLDDQDYFEDKIKSTDERWYKNQKDYYKQMKKAAQTIGGKRSEKDDNRALKRALNAADKRPLHRKGSLNRAFD